MLNSNSDSSQNKHDPGLMGLILIARFHQIPVSYDSLKHQFSPSVKEIGRETLFGDQEILLAAKSLGFRAKTLSLRPDEIDDAILPALGKDRHGEYFVLVRRGTPPSSAVGRESSLLRDSDDEEQWLIHNLRTDLGPKELSRKQLSDRWDGEAIVLTPRRSPLFGRLQEFNLKWFIPYLKKYWRHFSDVLAASFFIQLFGLITPLFFQLVMDKVLTHKAWDTLNVLAAGFLIAAIFEVALNAVRDYLFAHTTTRVDVSLGAALFDKLISLPLAWFQARQAGQSVARIRELDSLRRFITSTALTLVIDLSFTFIYFFLMWFYSSALTLVVLGSIPLYVMLSIFITPILKARLDRKFHFGAENQAFLVESVTGIETIKSLALEPRMRKSWENLLASYVTTSFRAQNAGQLASQAASFIQKLTTLLIIWIGAHQVMDGEMTVGQLVAFNMIAGRISGPILKLTQLWQDFQQAGISMTRLGDILNTPSEYAPESSYSSLLPIKGRLKFDNVIFRYHPKAPAVLDSLSLEIHSGEIVGLVGQSGSGKSTLAKLLLRLFPIESGRIQIDGVDLAMTDTVWLRQQIGVVLQENILFSGTIRESIAMSDPSVPMEKVEAAARMAGAHDFITELRKGYDTQVGERGANLSGGQRQRLAIARILIGNPRILIFDEATSALDFESENIIHRNMGLICKGRTAIIIAHRLSSVRLASRIFVLDKGRLVESGPPKKLMEQRGYFYRMVMAQSPPGPGRS